MPFACCQALSVPHDIETGCRVWTHTCTPFLISHGVFPGVRMYSDAPEALGGRSESRDCGCIAILQSFFCHFIKNCENDVSQITLSNH